MKLINLRNDKDGLFYGNRNLAKDSWEKIVKEIDPSGTLAWKQARKKWQNLVRQYKGYKYPPSGSGTEDGKQLSRNWKYYDVLDQILSEKHSINPPVICASAETPEKPSDETQSSSQSIDQDNIIFESNDLDSWEEEFRAEDSTTDVDISTPDKILKPRKRKRLEDEVSAFLKKSSEAMVRLMENSDRITDAIVSIADKL